jgi:recombination protein RecA
MKIGVMFGNPETTPGGNALKFYASVRMEIRAAGKIDSGTGEDKEILGNRVRVKVVKNKVAPPFKTAEFDIMYNKGISYSGDLLDLAVKYEFIRKSGTFFSYKEEKLGQGRENAKLYLEKNQKLAKEVAKLVKDKLVTV